MSLFYGIKIVKMLQNVVRSFAQWRGFSFLTLKSPFFNHCADFAGMLNWSFIKTTIMAEPIDPNTQQPPLPEENPTIKDYLIRGFLFFYFVGLTLFALYWLFRIWPTPEKTINDFVFCDDCLTQENKIMLMVVLGGMLGAILHAIISFGAFIGNRKFIRSWTVWYILRPVEGSTLALIFYVVMRAGILSAPMSGGSTDAGKGKQPQATQKTTAADSIVRRTKIADSLKPVIKAGGLAVTGDTAKYTDSLATAIIAAELNKTKEVVPGDENVKMPESGLNPFGIMAIAFMVGMFSKKAGDKLKEVFDTLFRSKEEPPLVDKLDKEQKKNAQKGTDVGGGNPGATS